MGCDGRSCWELVHDWNGRHPGRHGCGFIAKHDTDGNFLWQREYGTAYYDEARSVALDSSGNIYLTGWTGGILGGTTFSPTDIDAYIAKLDSSGDVLWTRQFSSPGTKLDHAFGVAVDALGNAYVVGDTYGDLAAPNGGFNDADVFVAKFDTHGVMEWARQFGSVLGLSKLGDICLT